MPAKYTKMGRSTLSKDDLASSSHAGFRGTLEIQSELEGLYRGVCLVTSEEQPGNNRDDESTGVIMTSDQAMEAAAALIAAALDLDPKAGERGRESIERAMRGET